MKILHFTRITNFLNYEIRVRSPVPIFWKRLLKKKRMLYLRAKDCFSQKLLNYYSIYYFELFACIAPIFLVHCNIIIKIVILNAISLHSNLRENVVDCLTLVSRQMPAALFSLTVRFPRGAPGRLRSPLPHSPSSQVLFDFKECTQPFDHIIQIMPNRVQHQKSSGAHFGARFNIVRFDLHNE